MTIEDFLTTMLVKNPGEATNLVNSGDVKINNQLAIPHADVRETDIVEVTTGARTVKFVGAGSIATREKQNGFS